MISPYRIGQAAARAGITIHQARWPPTQNRQRQYAMGNAFQFEGYDECCCGITASDGPGPATLAINGVEHVFYEYAARGVPYGPDDGTLAPWGDVVSLPFAPEIVLPAIRHFLEVYPEVTGKYCFKCSVNPTFRNVLQGERN